MVAVGDVGVGGGIAAVNAWTFVSPLCASALQDFVNAITSAKMAPRCVLAAGEAETSASDAPSNGRGMFYRAVKFALADYCGVAGPDLLERHGAHPTGEMTLRGMRLAVMSESGRRYHKKGAR